jgi:hypothetical protein
MSIEKLGSGFLNSLFSKTKTVALKLNEAIDGLNAATDGSETFNTVTATSSIITDVISEYTSGSGVTIDGLLIKDGAITGYLPLAGGTVKDGLGVDSIDTISRYLKNNSGSIIIDWELGYFNDSLGRPMFRDHHAYETGGTLIADFENLVLNDYNTIQALIWDTRILKNNLGVQVAKWMTDFSVSSSSYSAHLNTTFLTTVDRIFEFPDTSGNLLVSSVVTTETVVSDTTVTVNIGGVTYKLLAIA